MPWKTLKTRHICDLPVVSDVIIPGSVWVCDAIIGDQPCGKTWTLYSASDAQAMLQATPTLTERDATNRVDLAWILT